MITKIKYFFCSDNSPERQYKNTIEEIKKDVVDLKKKNPESEYLIYRNEINEVFDRNGNLIYSSDIIIRQFDDQKE